MKGHSWAKRKDAVDRKGNPIVRYPVWAEHKHDEIRCDVHVDLVSGAVQYLSYAGKPLHNMTQFDGQFLSLTRNSGFNRFDCGFEVNGNFNDSYRWVRSSRGLPPDLAGAPTQFYLFDLPTCAHPWYSRRIVRSTTVSQADWIVEPLGEWCHNEGEVDEVYKRAIASGLEGLMVKLEYGLYELDKRTDAWLKMKPEETADGVIVGIIEATATVDNPGTGVRAGDKLGRAGSVEVRTEDNGYAVPGGIAHALGRDMWLHPEKYIGQWVEFTYMQRDRAGGYRHPRIKRLREAKA